MPGPEEEDTPASYGIQVQDCKATLNPTDAHFDLPKSTDTPLVIAPLRHLVGSLLRLARYNHREVMCGTCGYVWLNSAQPTLVPTFWLHSACSSTCTLLMTRKSITFWNEVKLPIPMHTDNEGAMYMGRNLVTNKRPKYSDLRYHLMRKHSNNGLSSLSTSAVGMLLTY